MEVTQKCLIDLHLHLDGSVSLKSARELAKISNIAIPESEEELKKLMQKDENCIDLTSYLTKFDLPCKLLQTKESISQGMYNLCNELKDDGVIYAEIRYAPQLLTGRGLTQDEVVAASIDGLKRSKFNGQIILCAMRFGTSNKKENFETADLVKKYLHKGVCALDLAGDENHYKNPLYKDLFEYARELEIPFTIHAGEADGYISVDEALEYGASRIGHGVYAKDSKKTLYYLKEHRIPLEVCPTSNIDTNVFKRVEDMPFKFFKDYGLVVTINSDDQTVSVTTTRKEYQKVADAFNFNKEDIKAFLMNSVKAAYLDDTNKNKLRNIIEIEFTK